MKHIGANKFIFDIGANIGQKTDLFLKLGCKIVLIEPQSDLAKYLRSKYSDNDAVNVEQCGIGKEEGEAVINISTRYPGFSSIIKSWQKGTKYYTFDKTENVKMATLDKLISKYGLPDFCKIDVEGFEYEVLLGLSKKIPMINFEFHSNDRDQIEKCVSRLQAIGYSGFNFVIADNAKMASHKWLLASELWSEIEKIRSIGKSVIYGDIYAR